MSMTEITEPHIAARSRHLEILDGNFCAAIILNEFVWDFDIENQWREEAITRRIYTHAELSRNIFRVFSLEDINKALLFLMNKGFINATWVDRRIDEQEELPFEDRPFAVVVHWDKIEQACEPYYVRVRERQQRQVAARIEAERERQAKLPPPPPPPTDEELEQQQWERTLKKETDRVISHVKRAIKVGLPATLTVEEWIETLDHFEWRCAYCGGNFDLLEHFIPISHYAGTTKDNCVPACHGCNGVKQSWHPDKIPYSNKKHSKNVQVGIIRVREYLASLRKVEES